MSDAVNVTGNSYDDSSISQLIGADRVRRRPATILGSSNIDGARHGFTEIYGNALDEVTSGYGTKLDIVYYEDGSVSLRDYGRGVPLGWNENLEAWNWHIIYNELYGGGKYDKNQDALSKVRDWSKFNEHDYNYLYSVGLNGLGAAATQYTSEHFIVRSIRDGVCTEMRFAKGMPLINGEPVDVFRNTYNRDELEPVTYPTDEPNGTFIKWKPDADVFSEVEIGGDWLYERCRDIAHIAGVDLYFKDEKSGREEFIEAGNLSSLVQAVAGKAIVKNGDDEPAILTGSEFSHGTCRVENNPNYVWVAKLNYAIAFTDKTVKNRCYHNSVYMGGGVQYEAVYYATRDFFNSIAKSVGMKFDARDYEGAFNVVISTYSNHASFRGQTKDAIDDYFIQDLVQRTIFDRLNREYQKGNPHMQAIIDNVIQNAEQRIALAEYASTIKAVTKTVKTTKDPSKFKTCKAYRDKNYELAELWIAEGDSAAGALELARDSDTQAIIPIRGKFLNVLKATLKKILSNGVITDLMGLIGTGMDIGEGLFDADRCKFGKIVFATDADVDGFQIRVLLFIMLYRLAPELLDQNRVFIAETPRFEVVLSNGSSMYARDDASRDKILEENVGRVVKVNRFKGLGEVEPKVLYETTTCPETRTLIPVTLDRNDQFTRDIIDALFGADKAGRRKEILMSVLGEGVASMLIDSEAELAKIEAMQFEEETETVAV